MNYNMKNSEEMILVDFNQAWPGVCGLKGRNRISLW